MIFELNKVVKKADDERSVLYVKANTENEARIAASRSYPQDKGIWVNRTFTTCGVCVSIPVSAKVIEV